VPRRRRPLESRAAESRGRRGDRIAARPSESKRPSTVESQCQWPGVSRTPRARVPEASD